MFFLLTLESLAFSLKRTEMSVYRTASSKTEMKGNRRELQISEGFTYSCLSHAMFDSHF